MTEQPLTVNGPRASQPCSFYLAIDEVAAPLGPAEYHPARAVHEMRFEQLDGAV